MSNSYKPRGCQPVRNTVAECDEGLDECDGAPSISSRIPQNANDDTNAVCVSTDEGLESLPEGHILSNFSIDSVSSVHQSEANLTPVATTIVHPTLQEDETDEGFYTISLPDADRKATLANNITQPLVASNCTDSVKSITEKFDKLDVDKETAPIPQNENVSSTIDIHSLLYSRDEDGDTQLHLVITHMDERRTLQFLRYARSQQDVNIQNHLRQSPLHLAVLTRQPKVVQYLIRWGAQLDARDRLGNTPLHLACKYGYVDCVWLLMNQPDNKECSYIPSPSFEVEPQTIRPDISWTNYEGETCLHLAAGNLHIAVLQVLTNSFHVDINVTEAKAGRTILHQAVELEQVDMVKYLASNNLGVAIEARTFSGWTAVELLGSREPTDKRIEMMRVLLAAGASPPSEQSEEDNDSVDEMNIDDIDDFELAGRRI